MWLQQLAGSYMYMWANTVMLLLSAILLLFHCTITIASSDNPACSAASELASNQDCQNAISGLGNSIASIKPLEMSDLEIFCVNPCEDLVKRTFRECVSYTLQTT